METSYRIPGTDAPTIIVRRSALGSLTVPVDGTRLKPSRGRNPAYTIPMPDGTARTLRIAGQWTGLKAVVDGVETRLEPPIPRWAVALTVLPVGLIVLGGLVGAVIAVVAMAANAFLARQPMRSPVRAISMIGVVVAGLAGYLGVAFALSPLPNLAVGTCVNGISEGSTVTASSARAVDCASPHDNEVVGVVPLDAAGGFPGAAAIGAAAEERCPGLFADYVGVAYDASGLLMLPVTPSELSWAKGDHEIACVVLAADGARLTGSVRGSGR